MSVLRIPTAEVFETLLAPARYKGAHGGRGSGKSHFYADLLIEDSLAEKGLRSVCIREVQKSLKDSAKRLIEDKLTEHSLGEADGFKVFREVIEAPGDGVITFQGMQDQAIGGNWNDLRSDDQRRQSHPCGPGYPWLHRGMVQIRGSRHARISSEGD
ncbi:phage terminase large subunit [Bradyrhizobium tropiciagri]|nr:phage terminase large subunit [Bradyrhizobium tropiciagri]